MKQLTYLLLILLLNCSNEKKELILKTNSKLISIKDGEKFYNQIWTISPEVKIDEFVAQKFNGRKTISFISDIDTLTFNVAPNNTYDFTIQYYKENAFTRISTDTIKEPSIRIDEVLDYYYDDNANKSITDTIPFKLKKDNRIHLKGKINDSEDLDFLFDTGANAIVIVSRLIGNKVNLKLDGEVENEGSDGTNTVNTSSNNKLEIKNLNWDNVNLISINYQNSNFDGILGWIAFENKIVEINYDKNVLVIHKSIETVSKDYSKIETKMINDVPYIKGEIIIENKKTLGWFEYDSGYSDSFSLSQKFASENNLNNVMTKVGTSISTGSAGVEWKANDYILPKLRFENLELINIPLSIDEKDPKEVLYNNILGNNLLKQFNAIIDLKNFEIYLKPNHLLNR